MNGLTVYHFTHTTGEDQLNYFSGEFGFVLHTADKSSKDLEQGVYRVIDGQLYQVKEDLPPSFLECSQ